MKHIFFTALLLPLFASAQTRTIRMWFAYGDVETALRARVSGIDPSAEAGREISGSRLAVPTNGLGFKVSLWCQMTASDGQARYGGGPAVNVAFDRTFCGQTAINPPLDGSSFRKVRPAGANPDNYLEAFTNGPFVPAWFNSSTIEDVDGNGIQDTAQMRYLQTFPSAWRQGTQGSGESVRPVGLATLIRPRIVDPPAFEGRLTGFKLPNATPFRVIDINWVSMLGLGETYGSQFGETGLSITTSTQIGMANTTSIVGGATHTGARYTLVAVAPEPGAGVAFGIGALLLLRKRVAGG